MTVLRGRPAWHEDTADSADRCPRVAAHIRASAVMGRTDADPDAYLTLTIQRDAIQRWADANGVPVERWYEDEVRSCGGQRVQVGIRSRMTFTGTCHMPPI